MKSLLLQAHALHLGYLGCYGNEWVATPNIDRLAGEGIVFDQHYARHPGEKVTLDATEIRQLPSLAPPWKIPDDFQDLYVDDVREVWLHPPVGPLEDAKDLERLQNTYAAVVTHFDYQIGQLREELADSWDEMTVLLTASCGLALGEHGVVGPHRAWMHEEVWHVPLIVRLPGEQQAGRRVSALTQPGDSLWPLIRGEASQVREFAHGRLRIGSSEECVLRTLEWALLLPIQIPTGDPPRLPQLYVKPDDRWEVNDVRQQNLEMAESLEQKLREASVEA